MAVTSHSPLICAAAAPASSPAPPPPAFAVLEAAAFVTEVRNAVCECGVDIGTVDYKVDGMKLKCMSMCRRRYT